jgi:cytochrome c oxidase cbb3-type subunit 2
MQHETVEKNTWLMVVLILVVISIGGAVEIVPLLGDESMAEPMPGLEPRSPLLVEGRAIYIREGCTVCHTQMVRPLRTETERYGPYSIASEYVYDHPFVWGSKRTGPDLVRVGGRYSDDWHRAHLYDPRSVVPRSNMPAFPWLFDRTLDGSGTAAKMRALRMVGVPYTDEQIENAAEEVAGNTEADALIAYLQSLGVARRAMDRSARAEEAAQLPDDAPEGVAAEDGAAPAVAAGS